MKEVTPCEGDAIAVCVSNTGEAGIFWAAACIAMAKTKTVVNETRIVCQPPKSIVSFVSGEEAAVET
jgi:hypothetical protein